MNFSCTIPDFTKFSLFDEFERDLVKMGWIGNNTNPIKLALLSAASSILANRADDFMPVCIYVAGASSGGKSAIFKLIQKLLPSDKVIEIGSMSPMSLIYRGEINGKADTSLNGKILLVAEMDGLRDETVQYCLRELISSGRFCHSVTAVSGTQEVKIEAKPVIWTTTILEEVTRIDTRNRMLRLRADESEVQTKLIIDHEKSIRENPQKRVERKALYEKYQNYFKWFLNLPAPLVVVPYASQIEFNTSHISQRRTSKIFFDLLETIALINRYQRKEHNGMLISELNDYEILYSIISELDTTPVEAMLLPTELAVIKALTHLQNEYKIRNLTELRNLTHHKIYEVCVALGTSYGETSIGNAVRSLTKKRILNEKPGGKGENNTKLNYYDVVRNPTDNYWGLLSPSELQRRVELNFSKTTEPRYFPPAGESLGDLTN